MMNPSLTSQSARCACASYFLTPNWRRIVFDNENNIVYGESAIPISHKKMKLFRILFGLNHNFRKP